MLPRISTSPRIPHPLISRTCVYQQHARSYRNSLFRKPEVFYQTIVLTDGSTFKVMSTSPRKTYRLSRDKFNNPLWTGRRRSAEEDEQNQQLSKFRKAYSGALGGEASMKELREERLRKVGRKDDAHRDRDVEATDALFSLLESKDAYVPTRGREGQTAPPTGKTKGVRT